MGRCGRRGHRGALLRSRCGHSRLDLPVGVAYRLLRHRPDRIPGGGRRSGLPAGFVCRIAGQNQDGITGGGGGCRLPGTHRVGDLPLWLRQDNDRLRQRYSDGQQQPHRNKQPCPVPPFCGKAAAQQRARRQQHGNHHRHRQGKLQQSVHQSFHGSAPLIFTGSALLGDELLQLL